MSLIGKAAGLEKKFLKMVRGFIGGESGPHQLEIRQAILDEVEGKIQPIGDGVSVFPYNQLTVTLLAQDDDRRYFFESAFLEGGKLKSDIRDRLTQTSCKLPQRLEIEIKFTNEPNAALEEKGFQIDYKKQSASSEKPPARLVILRGDAGAKSYPLNKSNFNIGRLQEVRDKHERIVRRNDLAFAEGKDEISQSISRAHAHIFFDEKEGCYRLCDDNSAQGTHIFRDGRNIEVPRNSPRGVKMHDGDEIYFGKAYLRFEIEVAEEILEAERPISSTSMAAVQVSVQETNEPQAREVVNEPQVPEMSGVENAPTVKSSIGDAPTVRDQPIAAGEELPVAADEALSASTAKPTPAENASAAEPTPTENAAAVTLTNPTGKETS